MMAGDPMWWRLVARVLIAAHDWHIEKCKRRYKHDPEWLATPAERRLYEAVSDFWAKWYALDRGTRKKPMDDARRVRRASEEWQCRT